MKYYFLFYFLFVVIFHFLNERGINEHISNFHFMVYILVIKIIFADLIL